MTNAHGLPQSSRSAGRSATLRGLALGALIACAAGCFSGPDDIKFVRLFRPQPDVAAIDVAETQSIRPMTLRRIVSAGHLTEPIAWERDGIEFGHYEDLRWVESPQRMVERALRDELFEVRGVPEGIAGAYVDLEVLAFEQSLVPTLRAIVTLAVAIEIDGKTTRRRVSIETALADDLPETLARGMGASMHQAVTQAADFVTEAATAP